MDKNLLIRDRQKPCFYNIEDVNRVLEYSKYVANVCLDGYSYPYTEEQKVWRDGYGFLDYTFSRNVLPYCFKLLMGDMELIREEAKRKDLIYETTPYVGSGYTLFNYKQANDLEQILYDIIKKWEITTQVIPYASNNTYVGEEIYL